MNETLIKMGQRAQAAEQELMLLDTAAKTRHFCRWPRTF